jgi:hypothetical protein
MTAEDLLTRTLREVTEHTDYPSTSLATVAARAHSLRARRRRTAALAAAAAVAAVAVPGAVWLGHSPDTSPGPSHELSSGPTTGPTVSTSRPPIDGLDALARGAKPGIDYADDATYVDMNGTHGRSGALRKARSVTPVRGGLLVALPTNLPDGRIGALELLTDHGDQGLGCGASRFAMSADGVESAYWVMDSCTTGSAGRLYTGVNNTMGEAGPSYVDTPAGRVVEPVGFTSQGVVVTRSRPDYGDAQVLIYGPAGGPTRIPGLGTAGGTDQSHDLVAGQMASDPSTGIIVHAATGVPVSYIPHWTLGQFSPDGKYVLADQSRNGPIPDGVAIFDVATGHKVAELGVGGFATQLGQFAWESDRSVLAVAQDWTARRDAIVRFDLQGHATLATTPKQEVDQSFPVYRLATRP